MPGVRVFTYTAGCQVAKPAPPTHEQSIRAFHRASHHAEAELGDKAEWIGPLIEWANRLPGGEHIARSNYVAWHVHGRQVLKVTPSASALSIIAGVDAKASSLADHRSRPDGPLRRRTPRCWN